MDQPQTAEHAILIIGVGLIWIAPIVVAAVIRRTRLTLVLHHDCDADQGALYFVFGAVISRAKSRSI
ncbi:hypothetical protein [Nocardia acidivorans]|uniref:hypothetical protein n=1 Tax=Nocardia acidivorans TaxID=404580 RepID=UPI00082E767D|nr:hypothetical protein [Nocardia acidivorans]